MKSYIVYYYVNFRRIFMCDYVSKKNLSYPKKVFINWINKVQKEVKSNYGLTFSFLPIGSGSRNMVIKKCNENYFDLDYQIVLQKKGNLDINNCKKIKIVIRLAFDNNKPFDDFINCEDSTQALTIINLNQRYGFDIIITYKHKDDYYILRNNKNSNYNNNNDYEWAKQSSLKEFRKKIDMINGPKMWNKLRDNYKNKRHKYKNNNSKKSYQILNESLSEILHKKEL